MRNTAFREVPSEVPSGSIFLLSGLLLKKKHLFRYEGRYTYITKESSRSSSEVENFMERKKGVRENIG